MPFAELIQKLREQAGLSQSELARKAGVPVRSIQNWEQGHRQPRPPALLPLADALGISIEKLIKSMSEASTTADAPDKPPAKAEGKATAPKRAAASPKDEATPAGKKAAKRKPKK